ncbi:GyrI-like domain-containing protein [Facklamia sp. P13055]|uniref:GyrI-like domain-containing protein n=1 Tax=Facklamia sp. P13055 TaxID=3421952 RepID=UPI003D1852A5
MLYRIEKKPAMRIVGVKTALSDDMELNLKSIPKFWDRILLTEEFKTICNLSNENPKGILGVSIYRNPQDIFYCIASASNEVVPEGMFEYEIPESTWVVFENDGYLKENVQSIFRRFYTEWLPFSGYEYAGLPDIEVYPIYDKKPVIGHSEVWIAIKEEEE